MKKYLLQMRHKILFFKRISYTFIITVIILATGMQECNAQSSTIDETVMNPGGNLRGKPPTGAKPGPRPGPAARPGSQPPKDEGAKAPDQEPQKTVVPSAQPQISSGTGNNYGNLILSFSPVILRMYQGNVAEQSLVLNNPRGVTVDKAEIVVKYSPRYLDIKDADPDTPGVNLQPSIEFSRNPAVEVILNQVDTTKGIIRFTVKSLSENAYLSGTLATIKWVGIKNCFYTPLSFVFSDKTNISGTRVQKAGRDVLGWDYDPKDGIISGGVTILKQP
jgi:hypothetical protein